MKVTVSQLDKLEEQIRTNSAPKLEELVRSHGAGKIPRPLLSRYANLIRRLGGTGYSLKLLNPIVRDENKNPSVAEIIEYASCLSRLGLIDESIGLLDKIKHEPQSEIQYELAAAYVAKWDYPSSLAYFKKYLNSKDLSIYKICVGEINIAAALIYTDELNKSESLLLELLIKVQKFKFNLLIGNTLELLGEVAFIRGDFPRALQYFEESVRKVESSNPKYQLHLDKWKVIIRMLNEKGSKDSLKQFADVRKRVPQINDWHTIRELELFKAVATNDSHAILNLYFGTPYEEYRKRILSIWGKPIKINNFYDRQLGSGLKKKKDNIFDVALGLDFSTGSQLKPGQSLHRLLQILSTDFYEPFSTNKIFSMVFKDSFFNPITSPKQVYEVIRRLGEWFTKNKVPLIIVRSEGGYRLRATEIYKLRTHLKFEVRSKVDDFIFLLKSHGLTKNISVKMIVEKLNLAPRSVSRLLSGGVSERKLTRQGQAKMTTYAIIDDL